MGVLKKRDGALLFMSGIKKPLRMVATDPDYFGKHAEGVDFRLLGNLLFVQPKGLSEMGEEPASRLKGILDEIISEKFLRANGNNGSA